MELLSVTHNSKDVTLLPPVALCNFDLGIMKPSGATAVYIEGPLLEGTFLRFISLHVSA
jgi:hypothetical protein